MPTRVPSNSAKCNTSHDLTHFLDVLVSSLVRTPRLSVFGSEPRVVRSNSQTVSLFRGPTVAFGRAIPCYAGLDVKMSPIRKFHVQSMPKKGRDHRCLDRTRSPSI
ncbi:hypothetical protein HGRIS_008559 [Hohenbuehelia grisea]|uniref:Uncharacterized protein n=1 Tax=Hohenbuehelia grisea TaxID=104357 RepID=A0ABR3J8C1_9AGAR